jgi:arsenate reductase
MKKIYYLSSCSTCSRIIKELDLENKGFDFQDIKNESITPQQLRQMKQMSGSCESLFSRVALKYKALGLNKVELSGEEYCQYILDEYTFLKRPVIIIDNEIFIGNSKKNIEAVKAALV